MSTSPRYFRNLKDLAEDKNCTRARTILEEELELFSIVNIFEMEQYYQILESKVVTLLMHSDEKIIGAMYEMRSYLQQMILIVKEWAKETPWLQNSNTVEAFERIIEDVDLNIDVSETLRSVLEEFLGVENSYLKCKNGLGMNNEVEVMLCVHNALTHARNVPFGGGLYFNAYNDHPYITMQYPLLHALNNLNDEASKLGVVGAVLGHELSHTVIKGYEEGGIYIPYFSENVRICIQEQFNSTCEEYSEINKCAAYPQNIDENGADLLGNQLAYELLKNYYGDELHSQHPQISATYEQIFFFARGLWLCEREEIGYDKTYSHSPNNIRANIIVQLPEFQTAYNCSEDSRMIRSRTDVCTILGAGAPQIKRH